MPPCTTDRLTLNDSSTELGSSRPVAPESHVPLNTSAVSIPVEAADEVRRLLMRTPGNDRLNSAWQWELPSMESDGSLLIPPAEAGHSPIRIIDASVFTEKMVLGTMDPVANEIRLPSVSGYTSIISGLTSSSESVLPQDKKIDELHAKLGLSYPFSRPSSVHLDAMYEGTLLHEHAHAQGAAEYVAHREQMVFLRQVGGICEADIKVPNEMSIMMGILVGYPALDAGMSLAEKFDGSLDLEILKYLPGGELHEQHRADCLRLAESISPEVLQSTSEILSLSPDAQWYSDLANGWAIRKTMLELTREQNLSLPEAFKEVVAAFRERPDASRPMTASEKSRARLRTTVRVHSMDFGDLLSLGASE